jgi:hypothetical protein
MSFQALAALGLMLSSSGTHPTVDPTLMVFNESDWTTCAARVQKGADDGAKRVNFILNLYSRLAPGTTNVAEFCYRNLDGNCQTVTPDSITAYSTNLQACFQYAVRAGLGISVTPHIDDAGEAGVWRNDIVFDPLILGNGISYSDAMIAPIVDAIDHGIGAEVPVDFALEGEMGASIGAHPYSYLAILNHVKKRLKAHTELKVGLSLNFNKIFGTNPLSGPQNSAALRELFSAVDFVGVSNYCPVDFPVVAANFARGFQSVLGELKAHLVELPATVEFQISEMGLGGGTKANDSHTPAGTPDGAAAAPYSGIHGEFLASVDPWSAAPMQQFRLDYYRALTEFLADQNLPRRITRVYLWNSDSWDVNGLYSPAYRSDAIVEFLRAYNGG